MSFSSALRAGKAAAPLSGAAGKAVVVHSGARDGYQVARALEEAGMLEQLVTDLYWPADRAWARALAPLLPAKLRRALHQRSEPGVPASRVRASGLRGLEVLLLDRLPGASFRSRRRATRQLDARLGAQAGLAARRSGAGLLSYSYYAYDAFRHSGRPGMLFQLHPHPMSVRVILERELRAHPECAASLGKEWELALPEGDFRRLAAEPGMASRILVASSFTRRTLVENGVPAARITVVPYGVDTTRFHPGATQPARDRSGPGPLRLLFVGRINQRKGILYLLEALRRFSPTEVRLTVCGRVVDDLALLRPFGDQVTVRPSVGADDLPEAYRDADLFVLPSVAEGFGQVLLEALASGLPVLSTTHTAAPDLIREGREGFVVEPGSTDAIADRIGWALGHRRELAAMRPAARERAECFTWARFREGVRAAAGEFLESRPEGEGDRASASAGASPGQSTAEALSREPEEMPAVRSTRDQQPGEVRYV